MSEILNTIQTTNPREISGGWTSERYEYQRNFSILTLVDLQEGETDYRMLLDYYDDVAVLNHSVSPTKIRFYQVKTREDRHWRMTDITEMVKGAKPRSIIGKMYENLKLFSPHVDAIVFVTNNYFKFRLNLGGESGSQKLRIVATELDGVEASRINAALDRDFPASRPDHKQLLEFCRCRMGMLDQREHVTGRLTEFFHGRGGAEHVPIRPLYDALLSEVIRKSGPFSGFGIGGIEDFYRTKSIARAEITDLFSKAVTARRLDKYWDSISKELQDAGYETIDIIDIKRFSFTYVGARAAGRPNAVRFAAMVSWVAAGDREGLMKERSFLGRVLRLETQCNAYNECPLSGLELKAALLVHVLEEIFDHAQHSGAEAAA